MDSIPGSATALVCGLGHVTSPFCAYYTSHSRSCLFYHIRILLALHSWPQNLNIFISALNKWDQLLSCVIKSLVISPGRELRVQYSVLVCFSIGKCCSLLTLEAATFKRMYLALVGSRR